MKSCRMLGLAVVWLTSAIGHAQAQEGTWTTGPSMNTPRYFATSTLLPNGKVLIAGGAPHYVVSAAVSSTDLYDPATNTFAVTTPSMNVPRAFATATLLPNGKVLIAGGTPQPDTIDSLSSTELYDPVTNTFAATTPSMNVPRYGATATLLPNGKVLIAGGYDNGSFLSSTDLYDSVTNTFAATTPSMDAVYYGATATLLPNGKVLIAGGYDGSSYVSSTDLYDPVTNTFSATTPSMNSARGGTTATLLTNGKVLIPGGFDGSSFLSSVDVYDPVANTFAATTPSMNLGRGNTTATLLPNGQVIIAGGTAGNAYSSSVLSSTELYDPVNNTFAATTPSMNAARFYATATLLPNGNVLIAGGEGTTDTLSSTEIYTPTESCSTAITSVNGPSAPIALGGSTSVTVNFTDTNTADTHACSIAWGDGTSNAGTVSESNGSGTCTGFHQYTATGVYEVTFTITDSCNTAETGIFQFVVIYDANGGFVTGGGWINSPAGAYTADSTLIGKANFGFVSKYVHGATIPTGNTEFNFSVAGFDFRSSVYEWLVISGAKARYRGTGTVNNSGSYGFELTAWDGQVSGGGVDRFRIKIWDQNQGNAIVYDNQIGAPDGTDPTTVLGGGSIVIHQ